MLFRGSIGSAGVLKGLEFRGLVYGFYRVFGSGVSGFIGLLQVPDK